MGNQKLNSTKTSQFWKETLELNFRTWLNGLEADPTDLQPENELPPDLFSFYAELSSLRSEIHRRARRDHDVYTGIKETLDQFSRMLQRLTREQLKPSGSSQIQKNNTARQLSFRRSIVDLYERFERIKGKLHSPPSKGFFFSTAKWRSDWNSLKEGFFILEEHFHNLLRHEGIHRMNCKGRPFDPNRMKAVDFVVIDTITPNTVIEEISGGYFSQEHVLKYAEVKVAVAKGEF
jgi:molecular chaperone GrpE (heat shock protein)